MNNTIHIKGAKEHNLQNISLEIPKNKLVVFTGVSGSGKSSLAFDTIYAEGQRRYVESLSSYARQFLGIMSKPDVEHIDGLSPSISIDQKHVSHNPRSTVGTITEIYDYLRLLYAKVGHPFCPQCGAEIRKLSLDEITDRIIRMIVDSTGTDKVVPRQFSIISPVVRQKKGTFDELFSNLRAKGFTQFMIDKKEVTMSDDISLIKTNKHDIDVVIDAFSISAKQAKDSMFQANIRSRVFSAIEQAIGLSDGLVYLYDKMTHSHQLFSQKFSCPNCNISLPEIEPRMFSFNSPLGACDECRGIGSIISVDPELVLNPHLSVNEGGVLPFSRLLYQDTWFSRVFETFLLENDISSSAPLSELSVEKRSVLLHGSNKQYRVVGTNRYGRKTVIHEQFHGVVGELEKRYLETDSEHTRWEIQKYMRDNICPKCSGKRLKDEVLHIKVHGLNIYQLCELPISETDIFISDLSRHMSPYEQQVAKLILKEVNERLAFLKNVGLSYLNLNRAAKTLSGGESQRIRLASQIGSGLSGVIYVLDEPSIGLHPKDIRALVDSLLHLRDLGNTIIVVEHDIETIKSADHIVDFGPKAGKYGGNVVFEGSYTQLAKADTLTAKYLFKKRTLDSDIDIHTKPDQGKLKLSGCSVHNLKNITVDIPLGSLVCVTGVSGSGKSSLVVDTLYPALKYYLQGSFKGFIGDFSSLEGQQYLDKVYLVDQSSIGRTPRSNPATYTGVFDYIRDLFATSTDAKIRGYKKGRFSFNVRGGRCEKCSGAGTIKIEMQFLSDVYVPCDVCGGKRYNSETLEVRYKDKNIYDVLQMTIDEALKFFSTHTLIAEKLTTLKSVGLGYIELGRPAPTLSGGEAQRIKLAEELSKRDSGRTLYILDEPTTGLHMYDIEKLLSVLKKLINRGNTVVLIEHNLDVIAEADYIVDLGPDGGEAGGHVVYQGSTKGIVKDKNSHTAQFLRSYV